MSKTAEKTAAKTDRKPLQSMRTGTVVSDKRDKSRKVVVTFMQKHREYGKYLRKRAFYQVHDPENVSHTGDIVEIVPCRPISKTKSWRLLRVVEAGAVVPTEHVVEPV